MNERDRKPGRVLEAERPVEGGVAAADDHARLVAEDLLPLDEVVEPSALPVVDVFDLELARLEGAVAGRHDQHAGRERLALVRREDELLLAVHADPLQILHLLIEEDLGPELETLLDAEIDERLPLDLGMAGDVVDVLLGIDGRHLAAELAEAFHDPDGGVAVPRVVGGCETDGTGADDRDVDDVMVAHSELRLPPTPATIRSVRAAGAAAAATGMGVGGLAGRFVLRLEGGATPAGRLHVRVVDREARAHEGVDEVDLGADEVRGAERVDDDADAVHLHLVVPVLRATVEAERVLKARAASALHGDSKDADIAFRLLRHQLLDLGGGVLGNGDHSV